LLDIVIVNWNAGAALADCLRSICSAEKPGFALGRVIVVDNASQDGSLAGCEAVPLPLTIVRNAENAGFARACNQGARLGVAPYVLFLNPDVELSPGTLAGPVRFFEAQENQRVGVCGIRLTAPDGSASSSCFRLPRPRNLVFQAMGLDFLLPQIFVPCRMAPGELGESRSVEQVMGAFFLVRRWVFERLGGFDERFFMYYEEVDFSLRMRALGLTSYYLRDSSAVHLGGWSSSQVKSMRLLYSVRSRLAYAKKHFSRPAFACV
jgi:GT2 family glycosyltransferase